MFQYSPQAQQLLNIISPPLLSIESQQNLSVTDSVSQTHSLLCIRSFKSQTPQNLGSFRQLGHNPQFSTTVLGQRFGCENPMLLNLSIVDLCFVQCEPQRKPAAGYFT